MAGQHPRRRTVVRTICALLGGAIVGPAIAAGRRSDPDPDRSTRAETERADDDSDSVTETDTLGPEMGTDDESDGARKYVAVVDRIVDDSFVVLLLEDGGELVDQHVEPASEMDDVEETDILHVVLKDGSVLTYQHLDERPGDSADTDGGTNAGATTTDCAAASSAFVKVE